MFHVLYEEQEERHSQAPNMKEKVVEKLIVSFHLSMLYKLVKMLVIPYTMYKYSVRIKIFK